MKTIAGEQQHRTDDLHPSAAASRNFLTIDHLAQQGWGKLADGTIVWEDDHRVMPTNSGATLLPEAVAR